MQSKRGKAKFAQALAGISAEDFERAKRNTVIDSRGASLDAGLSGGAKQPVTDNTDTEDRPLLPEEP